MASSLSAALAPALPTAVSSSGLRPSAVRASVRAVMHLTTNIRGFDVVIDPRGDQYVQSVLGAGERQPWLVSSLRVSSFSSLQVLQKLVGLNIKFGRRQRTLAE